MECCVALRRRVKWIASIAAMIGALSLAAAFAQEEKVELKEGDKAPDFRLIGSDGNYHALSQYKGKSAVVLAFFPKASTAG